MPRLVVEPSQAVAALLKQRRLELGLTLRRVQKETENLGRPIPFTTLGKIENGRVDPGIKRLHLLLRLYDYPVQLVSDYLDLEEFRGELPADRRYDAEALYRDGIQHWKNGDLRKGVAHLLALRTMVPADAAGRAERQRALLSFSITVGSLGKTRMAQQIVNELLVDSPEEELLVPLLVQAAACWHSLGSCEAALGFLERAEARLAAGDHQQRGYLFHQRASVLVTAGIYDEADVALRRALRAYSLAQDGYGKARALGVRVRALFDQEDFAGALSAAARCRKAAEREGFKRLHTVRRLDEGRALVALNRYDEGLQALNGALSAAVLAEDPVLQFYAHHALWRAFGAAGDPSRAAVELTAAQYFVRHVDEASSEAVEIRESSESRRR